MHEYSFMFHSTASATATYSKMVEALRALRLVNSLNIGGFTIEAALADANVIIEPPSSEFIESCKLIRNSFL